MTVTITAGAATFTPRHLTTRAQGRPSRNVFHDVIGQTAPDVSLEAAGPRQGSHRFVCDDHAHAIAGQTFHAAAALFDLVDTVVPGHGMRYAVDGPLDVDDTGPRPVLVVPFREVPA